MNEAERIPLSPAEHVGDPVDYYIESPKDGVSCGCRIDTATKQRISEIVQSSTTRYRTESDVLRAAIHWFLLEKIAPRMDGRFQADLRLQAAAVRRAQTIARIQDSNRFVREVSSALKTLVLQGALDQAVETWLDTVRVIEASDDPFRTRAHAALMNDPELAAVRIAAESATMPVEASD